MTATPGIMTRCQTNCNSAGSCISHAPNTTTKTDNGGWKGPAAVTMSTMFMGALIFACGLHFGRAAGKESEGVGQQVEFAGRRPSELFLWSLSVLLFTTIIFAVSWMFLKRKEQEMTAQEKSCIKTPSEMGLPWIPTVNTCAKVSLKARKPLPRFSDVDTGESMSYTMIRTREWAMCNESSLSVGKTSLGDDWDEGTEKGVIGMVNVALQDDSNDMQLGEAVGKLPETSTREGVVFWSEGFREQEMGGNDEKDAQGGLNEGGSNDGESLESRKQREIERCEEALKVLQKKEKELKELEEENERLVKETARKVQGKTPLEREKELDAQIQSLEKALADEAMRVTQLSAELEKCYSNEETGAGGIE